MFKKITFLVVVSFIFCDNAMHQTEKKIRWGFSAHQRINKMAVFTLPEQMLPLYKKNIIYLTQHAVDADKRRYASASEGYNHFLDFEFNGKLNHNYNHAVFENASVYCTDSVGKRLLVFDKKTLHLRKKDYYFTAPAIKYLFGRDSVIVSDSFAQPFMFYLAHLKRSHDTLNIHPDSLREMFLKEKLRTKASLKNVFAIDTVYKHGILPYAILRTYRNLVKSFEALDEFKILKLSADLGHYVADAHVPLHTTRNYNGQLSGQEGIHAFWETRLPEIFAENQYTYFVGNAKYIENTSAYVFKIVTDSYADVNRVLFEEKALAQKYPPDKKYVLQSVGKSSPKTVYNLPYSNDYHTALNGMVEARMQKSIFALGCLWYSAWIEAGKPDLINLPKSPRKFNTQDDDINLTEDAQMLKIGDSLYAAQKKMLWREE